MLRGAVASTDWPVSDSVPVFASTYGKDTRVASATSGRHPEAWAAEPWAASPGDAARNLPKHRASWITCTLRPIA